MERYDPSKNSWETVASMADKRINFGVGVMLGFIFVVGGHNGVSHLSSIERYDPHQNQWTVCRPMKEPRTGRGTRRSGGSGVPLGVSFWVTWEKLQEVRVAGTCLQSLVLHRWVGPKVTPSVL